MSQQVLLSYIMPDGGTGSVYLDASVNEQHGIQAQVTDHQVESGPNVTDYIRPMPRRLSITGIVTNTPLQIPRSQSRGVVANSGSYQGQNGVTWKAVTWTGEFDRVRDVFGILVDAAKAGALFSIYTTLATYGDRATGDDTGHFAIVNFTVPREASSGNALNCTIDFQEIRTVDTQTVAALPSKVQKTHRGAKPGKTLDDSDPKATKGRTALKALVDVFFK